jgi:nickel transport protein
MRRVTDGLVGAALVLLCAAPALAHRIHLFASGGTVIEGSAYFSGGGALASATVRVTAPNGVRLGEVRTDAAGRFTFRPAHRCDHVFVVEMGDGHRAECTVPAAELPSDLPSLPGAPPPPPAEPSGQPEPADPSARELERAVARAVRPLREQIDRLEHRLRFRDVLGGLGYIAGLTGLAFYVLAVRRNARGDS